MSKQKDFIYIKRTSPEDGSTEILKYKIGSRLKPEYRIYMGKRFLIIEKDIFPAGDGKVKTKAFPHGVREVYSEVLPGRFVKGRVFSGKNNAGLVIESLYKALSTMSEAFIESWFDVKKES